MNVALQEYAQEISRPDINLADVVVETVRFLRNETIDRHIRAHRHLQPYYIHQNHKEGELQNLFSVWKDKPDRLKPVPGWQDELIDVLGLSGTSTPDHVPFGCLALLKEFDEEYGEKRERKQNIGRYAASKAGMYGSCSTNVWKGVRLDPEILVPRWSEFPFAVTDADLTPHSTSVLDDLTVMKHFIVPRGEPLFAETVCYVRDKKLLNLFEPYAGDERTLKVGCVSLLSDYVCSELDMKIFSTNYFRFSGYHRPDKVADVVKDAMRYMMDNEVSIVVFPELTVYEPCVDVIQDMLRKRTKRNEPPHLVVAGSRHRPENADEENVDWTDPDTMFVNEATVFDGFGRKVINHRKFARYIFRFSGMSLIEAVSQSRPESIPVLDLGIGLAVTLICKDFLVEGIEWLRQSGVDIWLVPSMTTDVGTFAGLSWARGSVNQGVVALANTCSIWTKQDSEFDKHKHAGFIYFPGRFPFSANSKSGLFFYGCPDDSSPPCGRCCVGVLSISNSIDFKREII